MTRFQPQWLQSGSFAAGVDRRLISALWPGPASAGGAVSPTTGLTLSAAAGQMAVPASNGSGAVLCSWDAPEQVTLDPVPPTGTNRIDLICCQVFSTDVGGAAGDEFRIVFTKGAEAATPTPPAVPANAGALAEIRVTGGAAAIVAGDITDRRPGFLAVPTALSRKVTATWQPAAQSQVTITATPTWISTSWFATVKAPPSGAMLARFSIFLTGTAAITVQAALFSGGSQIGASESWSQDAIRMRAYYEEVITGLTPGQTYTLYPAIWASAAGAFAWAGGPGGTPPANNVGPAVLVVEPL